MKVDIDHSHIKEAVTRSVERIYPTTEDLEKLLLSGKRLRMYIGIDPTSPHLHVGHAAGLLALKRFQDLGHEVILLIGDFTARIGDPTDKLAARQPLSKKQVKENLKTFKKQAAKIVSFTGKNPARIALNGDWHDTMKFSDVIKLAEHFTVQQMLERDMFERRITAQKPIGLHEFLYPLMQGYDSVALDVDMEIGGTDQIFNMLAGRTLMRALKNKEKIVLAVKLLIDSKTGKKLSKTEDTLINLDDIPKDMFGKTMAIPDAMILPLAELATTMTLKEIEALKKKENPRDAKLIVAHALVALYHSEKEAKHAEEEFIKLFSKKEFSGDIPELVLFEKTLSLLALVMRSGIQSKSEARRLIEQCAIRIDDVVLEDQAEVITLKNGSILKVGKKKFFKLRLK